MGKTRETANLTAENLFVTNVTDDTITVGTGITFYGGSVGIVSAVAFYGDGSNLSGVAAAGGGSATMTIGVRVGTAVTFSISDSKIEIPNRASGITTITI